MIRIVNRLCTQRGGGIGPVGTRWSGRHLGMIASVLMLTILVGACRTSFWLRPGSSLPGSGGPSPMLPGPAPKPLSEKTKEQFRKAIKPLMRQATVLEVSATSSAPTSAPITGTYFGGRPYAVKGDKWPVCTTCGKPLSFICQLNMKHRKDDALPARGLYTVFYCWNCLPWASDPKTKGQWMVRYYPKPSKKAAVELTDQSDPGTQTKFCTVTLRLVDSSPDWGGLLTQYPKVAETLSALAAPDPYDGYEEICAELTKRERTGSQLGGYPWWVQGDETPTCGKCGKLKELLVQIDSEEAAGLMWGDSGCLYLFVCPENPSDVDMTMQCY